MSSSRYEPNANSTLLGTLLDDAVPLTVKDIRSHFIQQAFKRPHIVKLTPETFLVCFRSREDATKALSLDIQISGRRVALRWSTNAERRRAQRIKQSYQYSPTAPSKKTPYKKIQSNETQTPPTTPLSQKPLLHSTPSTFPQRRPHHPIISEPISAKRKHAHSPPTSPPSATSTTQQKSKRKRNNKVLYLSRTSPTHPQIITIFKKMGSPDKNDDERKPEWARNRRAHGVGGGTGAEGGGRGNGTGLDKDPSDLAVGDWSNEDHALHQASADFLTKAPIHTTPTKPRHTTKHTSSRSPSKPSDPHSLIFPQTPSNTSPARSPSDLPDLVPMAQQLKGKVHRQDETGNTLNGKSFKSSKAVAEQVEYHALLASRLQAETNEDVNIPEPRGSKALGLGSVSGRSLNGREGILGAVEGRGMSYSLDVNDLGPDGGRSKRESGGEFLKRGEVDLEFEDGRSKERSTHNVVPGKKLTTPNAVTASETGSGENGSVDPLRSPGNTANQPRLKSPLSFLLCQPPIPPIPPDTSPKPTPKPDASHPQEPATTSKPTLPTADNTYLVPLTPRSASYERSAMGQGMVPEDESAVGGGSRKVVRFGSVRGGLPDIGSRVAQNASEAEEVGWENVDKNVVLPSVVGSLAGNTVEGLQLGVGNQSHGYYFDAPLVEKKEVEKESAKKFGVMSCDSTPATPLQVSPETRKEETSELAEGPIIRVEVSKGGKEVGKEADAVTLDRDTEGLGLGGKKESKGKAPIRATNFLLAEPAKAADVGFGGLVTPFKAADVGLAGLGVGRDRSSDVAADVSDIQEKSVCAMDWEWDVDLRNPTAVVRGSVDVSMRKFTNSYHMGRKLGGGTFGEVFLALEVGTGRSVAVKAIRKKNKSLTVIKAMQREIQSMQKVRHERVVNLHDAFIFEPVVYLVMEFCEEGDLRGFLRRQQAYEVDPVWGDLRNGLQGLTDDVIWHFAKQMGEGLTVLKSHRIIHRDLKPENLLLRKPPPGASPATIADPRNPGMSIQIGPLPLLKIGDFGLSRPLGAIPPPGQSAVRIQWGGVIQFPDGYGAEGLKELVRGLLKREPKERMSLERYMNHFGNFVVVEGSVGTESKSCRTCCAMVMAVLLDEHLEICSDLAEIETELAVLDEEMRSVRIRCWDKGNILEHEMEVRRTGCGKMDGVCAEYLDKLRGVLGSVLGILDEALDIPLPELREDAAVDGGLPVPVSERPVALHSWGPSVGELPPTSGSPLLLGNKVTETRAKIARCWSWSLPGQEEFYPPVQIADEFLEDLGMALWHLGMEVKAIVRNKCNGVERMSGAVGLYQELVEREEALKKEIMVKSGGMLDEEVAGSESESEGKGRVGEPSGGDEGVNGLGTDMPPREEDGAGSFGFGRLRLG
ncbi:Serine/threonine-protein kinase [Rhizophlyctis rosea]|uniref:Serine/threonine-protein kinase n=1 Tax=Rhizophlyctis rosea TaxID=64517 RepID=A0AAD5S9E7_9FUNG|nr:Serine/threonine-protein kinase [Rhizophlyctis rosea]